MDFSEEEVWMGTLLDGIRGCWIKGRCWVGRQEPWTITLLVVQVLLTCFSVVLCADDSHDIQGSRPVTASIESQYPLLLIWST